MKEIVKYSGCFVCGDKNPIGLKVKFYEKDGGAFAEFFPKETLEGYKGLLHGGILASLLDEIMIKAVLVKKVYCVTAEINVRYKKPAEVSERLSLFGYIEKENGRVYQTKGWAKNQKGEIFCPQAGSGEKTAGKFGVMPIVRAGEMTEHTPKIRNLVNFSA